MINFTSLSTGACRPLERELHYVKTLRGVVPNWKELGEELLHQDDLYFLDEIKVNYTSDVRTCCNKMFDTWLITRDDACWDQLCNALNQLHLRTAEKAIKEKYYKGTYVCMAMLLTTYKSAIP